MTEKLQKDKPKKKRATKYDKPLKIHRTFDQAIKALVQEPTAKYETKKKK